jgi:UPF0716 protein FxsA
MGRLVLMVLVALPLIEIGLFVLVGQLIGLWPTLLGVVVTGVIGFAILRHQGGAILAEMRRSFGSGALPARAMGDGVMVALGGVLLMLPGYFTDCVGLLLLVPAVRRGLYAYLARHVRVVGGVQTQGFAGRSVSRPGTIDLDVDEWRQN